MSQIKIDKSNELLTVFPLVTIDLEMHSDFGELEIENLPELCHVVIISGRRNILLVVRFRKPRCAQQPITCGSEVSRSRTFQ